MVIAWQSGKGHMNVVLLLMAVLLSLWAMGLSLCKCKSPLLCTCLQILKTQRMVQVVIMSVLEQCRGMHVHGLVASKSALGGSLWTVLSKKSKFSTYACYCGVCMHYYCHTMLFALDIQSCYIHANVAWLLVHPHLSWQRMWLQSLQVTAIVHKAAECKRSEERRVGKEF